MYIFNPIPTMTYRFGKGVRRAGNFGIRTPAVTAFVSSGCILHFVRQIFG